MRCNVGQLEKSGLLHNGGGGWVFRTQTWRETLALVLFSCFFKFYFMKKKRNFCWGFQIEPFSRVWGVSLNQIWIFSLVKSQKFSPLPWSLACSDLSVSRSPGETGGSGGTDDDPLGGAGDGLHGVGGQAAQQLGSAVLVLSLASPLSCHVVRPLLRLFQGNLSTAHSFYALLPQLHASTHNLRLN